MLQEAYVRSNDPVESLIFNWKTGEQVAQNPWSLSCQIYAG